MHVAEFGTVYISMFSSSYREAWPTRAYAWVGRGFPGLLSFVVLRPVSVIWRYTAILNAP
jgi:hypothetical protein